MESTGLHTIEFWRTCNLEIFSFSDVSFSWRCCIFRSFPGTKTRMLLKALKVYEISRWFQGDFKIAFVIPAPLVEYCWLLYIKNKQAQIHIYIFFSFHFYFLISMNLQYFCAYMCVKTSHFYIRIPSLKWLCYWDKQTIHWTHNATLSVSIFSKPKLVDTVLKGCRNLEPAWPKICGQCQNKNI